jgi:hypothetical protein
MGGEFVEFDYDTWKTFKTRLVLRSGQKHWPLRVLEVIRTDCDDEEVLVAIVKKDQGEDAVKIRVKTGECIANSGTRVLMDLDNPFQDAIDSTSITLRGFMTSFGAFLKEIPYMVYKGLKKEYGTLLLEKLDEIFILPTLEYSDRELYFLWLNWEVRIWKF